MTNYQDGDEERMCAESKITEYQVNYVVDNLRVLADLTDTPLECSSIAHDTQ